MTLGAVVVAFRDPDSVVRSLESLCAVEDVVVVNVCADPDVTAAVAALGRVEIQTFENVGYGAAVNIGVASLAPAVDEVMFLNADVQVQQIPSNGAESAVRIPLQSFGGSRPEADLHSLPTPGAFCREWILGRPHRHSRREMGRDAAANGAAIVAPRDVLRSHPLPTEYFLYWEETAWFWRLRDHQIMKQVEDDFVVARRPGAGEFPLLKARLLGRNLVRLACERYGRRAVVLYVPMGTAWVMRLVLSDAVQGRLRQRVRYRIEMLRGVMSGGFTFARGAS